MTKFTKYVDKFLRPKITEKPVVLDLFAGCGGLSLGSPAALFDRYTAEDLLIAQKSLNNYFSKCGDEPKVYRNAVCEIRKGVLITKESNRGRKKEY